MNELTNVQKLALALGFVGWIVNLNGRRLLRAELEHRMRLHVLDTNDTSRLQPMGSRKVRRAVAKMLGCPFRPVYFHGVPVPAQKTYVKTMMKRSLKKLGNPYPHEIRAKAVEAES